jgi:ribosomal protein L7/L12
MQDVELLERLLEAHRELGSLRAKLAEAQAEAQRARLESLDPARIRKLMEEVINEDHWSIPLIKLYRGVMGAGLRESKEAIDCSPLGRLIRSNVSE